MLAQHVVKSYVEHELAGLTAWADRGSREVTVDWYPDELLLKVSMIQPATGEVFRLVGRFDDYRALPPFWSFADGDWDATTDKAFWPRRTKGPAGSSVIHNKPVICAPFNRLAYKAHGGPHGDWGGPTQWLSVQGKARGDTVGEMLSTVYRDFKVTTGRMG